MFLDVISDVFFLDVFLDVQGYTVEKLNTSKYIEVWSFVSRYETSEWGDAGIHEGLEHTKAY